MQPEAGHWAVFYRGGAIVSCPVGHREGYDAEIRTAWEAFFRAAPHGATIVDVGTGNGAIPLIAADVSRKLGADFHIHGIDLAAIDPPADVADGKRRFAGITFHAGIGAEQLPFASASVQAVSSQFGIEYSDTRRSLRELARVLAPDGRAQVIAHHEDSIVTHKARQTERLGTLALEELALFELTRSYLRAERARLAIARELHAALAARSARLREAASVCDEPLLARLVLDWLARLFEIRDRYDLEHALASVQTAEADTRAWLRRVRDLLAAAWSPGDAERFVARARAAGLQAAPLSLQRHAGDRLVGWCVNLHRD